MTAGYASLEDVVTRVDGSTPDGTDGAALTVSTAATAVPEELIGAEYRRYPVTITAATPRLVVQLITPIGHASSIAAGLSTAVLPTLTLGPVIGTVTATTAVVLVEVSAAASVALVLTDPVAQHSVRVRKACAANRPAGVLVTGLRPNTRYEVRCCSTLLPHSPVRVTVESHCWRL